jgi:hypothetical protein
MIRRTRIRGSRERENGLRAKLATWTMLVFLPKPSAYHSSQSVFAIRQDPKICVSSSTEKGLYRL